MESYNVTVTNKELKSRDKEGILWNQLPQALPEWGARICYNSLQRHGRDRDFFKKIIISEHYDIFEHAWAEFTCKTELNSEELLYHFYQMTKKYKYLEIKINWGEKTITYSGNIRVWLQVYWDKFDSLSDAISYKDMHDIYIILHVLFPNIFDLPEYLESQKNMKSKDIINKYYNDKNSIQLNKTIAHASIDGKNGEKIYTGPTVFLLGYTPAKNPHMVIQVTGFSRACANQMTRHRTMSFSQESQRYVEEDGKFVIPPSMNNEETLSILNPFFSYAMNVYKELRNTSLKENARIVLPNATETKIVMSGPSEAWLHFFHLRCAKDAQEEIRSIALACEQMYYEIGAHYEESSS